MWYISTPVFHLPDIFFSLKVVTGDEKWVHCDNTKHQKLYVDLREYVVPKAKEAFWEENGYCCVSGRI